MPIVGVICPFDNTPQTFETCISCHENRSKTRQCHAPVFVLKSMRDNHITRTDAGVSASTIIACPRAVAIEEQYDVYEPVISGYNKARGTWLHAMFESDANPPDWIIRERRLYYELDGLRISGKPDEVDTKYGILIDYKSKDNLPKKRDDSHELQFNIYAFLLRNGIWADTKEKANINVETIAAHYVTFKTKVEGAWLKMKYPVWSDDQVLSVIEPRIKTLVDYKTFDIMPACNAYVSSPYWKCQCTKYEEQLQERGIIVL